jgi:DNA repair protein RadC
MKYLRRLQLKFEESAFQNPIRGQVRGPEQLFGVFKDLKDETKEALLGVYLDDGLELNSYELLTIGGQSVTLVLPDEIFRGAILTNSPYFVLVHNHPSGKAKPSPEDRQVMAILRDQSVVMRRHFLDFIIVGKDSYWSMFEEEDGGEYSLGSVA